MIGRSLSPTGQQWVTRASAGGIGAWETVDAYQFSTNPNSECGAFSCVADNSGHVLVGGYGANGAEPNLPYHWQVRKFPMP